MTGKHQAGGRPTFHPPALFLAVDALLVVLAVAIWLMTR